MHKIGNNIRMFLWMIFLTGIIYPLLITVIAQLTMKKKADGDFVIYKNNVIGAALIGQKFESNIYFWPRPSAVDYDLPSGGSNLGPTSLALKKIVEERREKVSKDKTDYNEIPSELLFASGSGLDPHISVKTAYFQIRRIAKARNLSQQNEIEIKNLVDRLTIHRRFGFLGVPCVNVLQLNLALNEL